MKITPVRYWIETEISESEKYDFFYEVKNQYFPDEATIRFIDTTIKIYNVAMCVRDCFQSEKLSATKIYLTIYEKKVTLCKNDFEEISVSVILEAISKQI